MADFVVLAGLTTLRKAKTLAIPPFLLLGIAAADPQPELTPEPGTPVFLTALANDSTAAKILVLADMLAELGHEVSLHISTEVHLVAGGTIDATGLRQIEINAALPGALRQLRSTISADHAFSARLITEEIAWFEAQLP